MEVIFHSHANNNHFYKKGCALDLILKVRVFGTRKWPIVARGLYIVDCIFKPKAQSTCIGIFLKTEIFFPQFAKKYASKRSIFESFSPVHTN